MAEYDYLFKLVLAGDEGVGKSSVLLRYVDDAFTDSYISTIGVDFKISQVQLDNSKVKLQLWDTAGQVRFRTITRAYYRGAHGVIMVFDLTYKKSFDSLPGWLADAKGNTSANKIFLIGNKSDLEEKREVTTAEATAFAAQNGLEYYEVSAKDDSNIKSTFMKIAESVKATVPQYVPSQQLQSLKQESDEEDNENFELADGENVLDEKNATDTEVLAAVGDPCTIVEYVAVIRRQYFELQNLKKQFKERRTRR